MRVWQWLCLCKILPNCHCPQLSLSLVFDGAPKSGAKLSGNTFLQGCTYRIWRLCWEIQKVHIFVIAPPCVKKRHGIISVVGYVLKGETCQFSFLLGGVSASLHRVDFPKEGLSNSGRILNSIQQKLSFRKTLQENVPDKLLSPKASPRGLLQP